VNSSPLPYGTWVPNHYRAFRDRIIAEAIGVDDSKWRSITLERGQVCKDGGIIVHIHEVSA